MPTVHEFPRPAQMLIHVTRTAYRSLRARCPPVYCIYIARSFTPISTSQM